MAYIDFDIVRSVKRWFSEFAIRRAELRTERHLNSLPEYVLKDIGWPDAYAERLSQRNSMRIDDAGVRDPRVATVSRSADWTKHYEALKIRKNNTLELGC
ncbi:hypothetical protein [Phyllobacterium sp. SB3]|uniref:DUF1127 domain-containing protein n=1 Tax=Phyllobacterium sp. SB3 TaxID=3156073 RepID=UPI0032AFB61E